MGQGMKLGRLSLLVGIAAIGVQVGGITYAAPKPNLQAYFQTGLTGYGAVHGDQFAEQVDLSGNNIIVGAPGTNQGTGAVYFFTGNNTSWSQVAIVTPYDVIPGDRFGASVSISGNEALIGAPGANNDQGVAYIYDYTNGYWQEQRKLTASDRARYRSFGRSVGISGDHAVVGSASTDGSSGVAYLFDLYSQAWHQDGEFAGMSGDRYGYAVSINQNVAVVGAYRDSAWGGAVYAYQLTNGMWSQLVKITNYQGSQGDDFGFSVHVSGRLVLIGAPSRNYSTGEAYIFNLDGNPWYAQASLTPSDGMQGDRFGASGVLRGTTALVGENIKNFIVGYKADHTYLFSGASGYWTQQQIIQGQTQYNSHYGSSIGLSGNLAVLGAPTARPAGAVGVFSVW